MNPQEIHFTYPDTFGQYATVKAWIGDDFVGHADLIIDGGDATLTFIEILDKQFIKTWWLPFYKTRVNYRGRGYGSLLLKTVSEYCITQNIQSIKGLAHGDLKMIIPWYERHGFTVDNDNNIQIELQQ